MMGEGARGGVEKGELFISCKDTSTRFPFFSHVMYVNTIDLLSFLGGEEVVLFYFVLLFCYFIFCYQSLYYFSCFHSCLYRG